MDGSKRKEFEVICVDCGQMFIGTADAIRCEECQKEWDKEQDRWKYNGVAPEPFKWQDYQITWDEIYTPEEAKAITLEERLVKANAGVLAYNEMICCDLWGHKSPICKACKQGKSYLSGGPDRTNRCCPEHPVAASGKHYKIRLPYTLVDGHIKNGGFKDYGES